MLIHREIPEARWHVVESDVKRNARINCISHMLKSIPFEHEEQPRVKLPKVQKDGGYQRPPEDLYAYVPDVAAKLADKEEGLILDPNNPGFEHLEPRDREAIEATTCSSRWPPRTSAGCRSSRAPST